MTEIDTPRYSRGAVIQTDRDSCRYYHITGVYRDVDTGRVLYRFWDATHTHMYHALEEDIIADYRPAGICLRPGIKPASVFGGRIGGVLVGYRNLWGKSPGETHV